MEIIHLEDKKFSDVIRRTSAVLENGGLVIAPSDTVYGVLVDAANEKAVSKLIDFKNRPIGKSISVFVENMAMAKTYVHIKLHQEKILAHLLPGPFTVVLPSSHKTSKMIESEKGTLGIRLPDYAFLNQLLTEYGKAVTATSANLGGRSPHYSVSTLMQDLPESKKKLIDLVIDAGKLPRHKPSTVVDLTGNTVNILRKGDIVFSDEESFMSHSPSETRQIASYLTKKVMGNKYDKIKYGINHFNC